MARGREFVRAFLPNGLATSGGPARPREFVRAISTIGDGDAGRRCGRRFVRAAIRRGAGGGQQLLLPAPGEELPEGAAAGHLRVAAVADHGFERAPVGGIVHDVGAVGAVWRRGPDRLHGPIFEGVAAALAPGAPDHRLDQRRLVRVARGEAGAVALSQRREGRRLLAGQEAEHLGAEAVLVGVHPRPRLARGRARTAAIGLRDRGDGGGHGAAPKPW